MEDEDREGIGTGDAARCVKLSCLTWNEMLFTVILIPRCETTSMSKRLLSFASVAFVLFATVVHACPDLSEMQMILQTPCHHASARNETRSNAEKHNCDSVRYGMLSTPVSVFQADLSNLSSIPLHDLLPVSFSSEFLPSFWRSQGPPFSGLRASPRLSHVVLRI